MDGGVQYGQEPREEGKYGSGEGEHGSGSVADAAMMKNLQSLKVV